MNERYLMEEMLEQVKKHNEIQEKMLDKIEKHNEIQEEVKREMELQNDLMAYSMEKHREIPVLYATDINRGEYEDLRRKQDYRNIW